MNPYAGKIFLITGTRDVGKTRFCSRLVKVAKNLKIETRGVLSVGGFKNGSKQRIDLVDISNGNKFLLAVARSALKGGLVTDRWSFDLDAMAQGSGILQKSIPCDLLVIDELGPLEFSRGTGWQEGIRAVESGQYHAAVVVIRPELISVVKERWENVTLIDIPANMDDCTEKLLQEKILGDLIRMSTKK